MKILYQWVENLAFYMVLITAVLRILPGKEYEKYIRVFIGMILILLLILPLLKLTGMEEKFFELYDNRQYEMEKEELKKHGAYLEEIDLMDFIPDEYKQYAKENSDADIIDVEEIRVGE